jgi:phage tail sheath protein FI
VLFAPGADTAAAKTLHETLLAISPLYKSILNAIRENVNLLPPSAAMAGIYSMVDNQIGVFQSPANVSMGSVSKPAVNINNEEQEDLNLPLSGKAINAIRTFPGKGILVWGARTLDGNSQDWRYISVRRTVIFIEQSVKYAAEPYVFAPNTASTWANVKALITNFLTNVWKSGALAGATPEDAFSVDIGLGVTMTPVDILDGFMNITVKIAVTRPAEFIVITFQQKMQQS